MKKLFGWSLFTALLLGALLVAGVLVLAGTSAPGTIEINGEPLVMSGLDLGDGLGAIFGLLFAGLVMLFVVMLLLVVVPVAVLVPLLVVGLLLCGAFAAVAGVVALLCSPLLLLIGAVWLIARLAHGRRRDAAQDRNANADRTDSGATFAA